MVGRCDRYMFLCTTNIPIINLMACYHPRASSNLCSLSSVTPNPSIPGGWRGHVLRCLPTSGCNLKKPCGEKKKKYGTRAVFNDILTAYLALEVVKDIIMLLSVVVQKNIEKGKN